MVDKLFELFDLDTRLVFFLFVVDGSMGQFVTEVLQFIVLS